MKRFNFPRIVTAALKGGAGKTLITVGLIAALRRLGLRIGAFKKGPDYIDAGWLGLAAGADCHNLDSFLMPAETLRRSFLANALERDISIIEGNRGLYDGVDAVGSYSTAELAKFFSAPIMLIIDAVKMTRTAAALVLGAQAMDRDANIAGVILNRVAGSRHERILRDSIEKTTGIPVIGAIKKLAPDNLPQRHLGLMTYCEHPEAQQLMQDAADIVEKYVDLKTFLEIAETVPKLTFHAGLEPVQKGTRCCENVKIGVIRDPAFQFYYPENFKALTDAGADLVFVNALETKLLPQMDALYIGGGFPEVYATKLAENVELRRSISLAAKSGLPIYAECGGLMYLSESIQIDHNRYPMVGVFQADTIMQKKPQGLGYVTIEVTSRNPFYPVGTMLTGHEFHYSKLLASDKAQLEFAFRVLRGLGMGNEADGITRWNCLGTYLHVHAAGTPRWAEGLLKQATNYRRTRNDSPGQRHRPPHASFQDK